jgi:hypothetical protein
MARFNGGAKTVAAYLGETTETTRDKLYPLKLVR